MASANQNARDTYRLIEEALKCHGEGKLEHAVRLLDQALAIDAKNTDALNLRGTLAYLLNDDQTALRLQKQAVMMQPNAAGYRINYALSLRRCKKFAEAREELEKSIKLEHDNLLAHANLGLLLYEDLNEYQSALPHLKFAAERVGANSVNRRAYGACLLVLAQYPKALEFLLSVENDPAMADAELLAGIATAYYFTGNVAMAQSYANKAVAKDKNCAQGHFIFGCIFLDKKRTQNAVTAFQAVLKIEPDNFDARQRLIETLSAMHDHKSIAEYIQPWLDDPQLRDHPIVQILYLRYLMNIGDYFSMQKFGNLLRKKIAGPDYYASYMSLAGLVLADDEQTSRQLFDYQRIWAKAWEKRIGRNLIGTRKISKRSPRRIGILSSDLRDHSVGKFLLPIYEKVPRDQIEFFSYSLEKGHNDHVFGRFRELSAKFHDLDPIEFERVAETIAADEIDILIELNGMTLGSCLHALATRCAPVQMSWLGYPFSTGLKNCDYLLLDKYLAPENSDCIIEKPLILDGVSYLCFGATPPRPIGNLPADVNGYITFGSQNSPYKLAIYTIDLWRQVLLAVPESKFLYVRPEFTHNLQLAENVASSICRNDIDPSRLIFKSNYQPTHLDHYNDMDISLDTYPVTGGTTTMEALWMGVPVISRVGAQIHQRVSNSILHFAGLKELCVNSDAGYVDAARRLAGDLALLRHWRKNLRTELSKTSLIDSDRFTAGFVKTLLSV